MKFFNFGASVSNPVEMAADVSASEEPIAHLQFQESNPEADTEIKLKKENALLKSENDLLKSENALLRSEKEELQTNHSSEIRQQKEQIHELLDRIHHFEKKIGSKVTESFTQTEATIGEDQENSQSVSVSGTSASVLPKASGAISKEAITKDTPPRSEENSQSVPVSATSASVLPKASGAISKEAITKDTPPQSGDNSQSVSVSATSASVLPKASGPISKEAITKDTPPQSGEKNPKVKSLKKKRSFRKFNYFQMDMSSSPYRRFNALEKNTPQPPQLPPPPPILNENNFPSFPNQKPSYAGVIGQKPLTSPPIPLAPAPSSITPSKLLHPTRAPHLTNSFLPQKPIAIPPPQVAQSHSHFVPHPHPSSSPAAKRVIIYGTSNYQTRHHQLKSSLRSLRQDSTEQYDIQFIRSYTLEKTFEMVKTRDHSDAIVVVSVLTNNAKKGQSLSYIRGYQEAIIWMLKQETNASNIVFLACPPATAFQTRIYNCYIQDLCDEEAIRFSNTLIKEENLCSDGYHLQFKYQHLMSKSVAAAVLDMEI